MKSSPPQSLTQIREFLQVSNCTFSFQEKTERNTFLRKTIWNIQYHTLSKKEKGWVIQYVGKITGLSTIQAKRLIGLAHRGELGPPKSTKNKSGFQVVYTASDIHLLAQIDELLAYPGANALRANLKRMYYVYKDERYKRLCTISHGHVYNLRKSNIYKGFTRKFQHTKPVFNNEIGIREKPSPDGPGYLRVDTVHGGDLEKAKGVYYINLVDELTQWEVVVCVEGISERFLASVWEEILNSFPFVVKQFHSDNGSEFINHVVAKLLNTLQIRQSKSRPRRHNDNGLVESKNGWVIRKHFGYTYVQANKAPLINDYLQKHFNTFLNFHRPCAFPTKTIQENGKVTVRYHATDYKTPYEKLKELDHEGKTLKSNTNYKILDTIQMSDTDFDYAKKMKKEYHTLLKKLHPS